MGLFDRFKKGDTVEVEAAPSVVLDTGARTKQLLVLASDLDDLVAAMRADPEQRYNPGWAGRIAEYERASERARALRRDGFDQEALLDLAAEVRPLFVRGQSVEPDPAMVELEPLQDAVTTDVADLRRTLPGEAQGA